jgi:hypothetical protein
MKSVVQAAWLWTVAFGNLIVIIVAKSKSGMSQVSLFKSRFQIPCIENLGQEKSGSNGVILTSAFLKAADYL